MNSLVLVKHKRRAYPNRWAVHSIKDMPGFCDLMQLGYRWAYRDESDSVTMLLHEDDWKEVTTERIV